MKRLITFGKQTEFVESPSPFIALVTGVGGGKTQAGATKSLKVVGDNPGVLGMVTAPTYKMLSQATIRTYIDVFDEYILDYAKGEQSLKVRGGEILFRSTEDPETLRGPNLGFFHMDEPAMSPLAAFLILQGRLRQPGVKHQGWLTGTPKGYNWLFQEFVARKRAEYQLITYSARENPFLPPDFIRRLEESYKGDFALQEIEGAFVVVGGDCLFALQTLKAMFADCREPIGRKGLWSIWKEPIVGRFYTAGLDTATGEVQGEGSESASVIVDAKAGEVVAELHGSMTPDLLAEAVVPTWGRYNEALACPERMGPAGQWAIHKIGELGYHRLWAEKGKIDLPGWTMGTNRNDLLLGLEEAVRTREIVIPARSIIDQMFTFVRGKDGKFRATEGARDDLVVALALAWRMREERHPEKIRVITVGA